MNIYVSNLASSVTEDALKELFEQKGEVSSVKIIKDKFTGDPRGFGFVEMPNDDEAKAALDELNNQELENQQIRVAEAKPREDRPRRDFRSGGGGGGSRGGFGGPRGGGGGDRGGNRGGGGGGWGSRY